MMPKTITEYSETEICELLAEKHGVSPNSVSARIEAPYDGGPCDSSSGGVTFRVTGGSDAQTAMPIAMVLDETATGWWLHYVGRGGASESEHVSPEFAMWWYSAGLPVGAKAVADLLRQAGVA